MSLKSHQMKMILILQRVLGSSTNHAQIQASILFFNIFVYDFSCSVHPECNLALAHTQGDQFKACCDI